MPLYLNGDKLKSVSFGLGNGLVNFILGFPVFQGNKIEAVWPIYMY